MTTATSSAARADIPPYDTRLDAGPERRLTTQQCSELVGCDPQSVRNWINGGRLVGHWDSYYGRFLVPESGLRAFLIVHWGKLPAGLRRR
jgi:hypothetical protein